MADMAVGSLAPLTFVALGIPFLYYLLHPIVTAMQAPLTHVVKAALLLK